MHANKGLTACFAELLRSVGMGERLGHVPSQLSGGEQQRVTIGAELCSSLSLLLCTRPKVRG
eukprot:352287-Rhodomonas_salina.4